MRFIAFIVSLFTVSANAETLQNRFDSLADAQKVFPFVDSLEAESDWAELQQAINEAGKVGGIVQLEPREYRINRPLKITNKNDGVLIQGAGWKLDQNSIQGGTVILCGGLGDGQPAILIDGQDTRQRAVCSIRRLVIDGENKAKSHGIAMHWYQRYNVLEDVEVRRFIHGAGVLVGTSWSTNFHRVYLRRNRDGIATDGGRYNFFGGGTNTYAHTFTACHIAQNKDYGLWIGKAGAYNWNFHGGVIEGNAAFDSEAAQIASGGFNRSLSFHGTWFEWGNQNNNPLIELHGINARDTYSFYGCLLDQNNAAPIVQRAKQSNGVIDMLMIGCTDKPSSVEVVGFPPRGSHIAILTAKTLSKSQGQ